MVTDKQTHRRATLLFIWVFVAAFSVALAEDSHWQIGLGLIGIFAAVNASRDEM